MEIKKNLSEGILKVELIGRLDAVTATDLDKELKPSISDAKSLVLDLKQLDYIASAGLRILLKYQKLMDKSGNEMKIVNVKPVVKEVLDMTGFSDFLHIVDGQKKLTVEI